jgi:hypothetical protein
MNSTINGLTAAQRNELRAEQRIERRGWQIISCVWIGLMILWAVGLFPKVALSAIIALGFVLFLHYNDAGLMTVRRWIGVMAFICSLLSIAAWRTDTLPSTILLVPITSLLAGICWLARRPVRRWFNNEDSLYSSPVDDEGAESL